MSLWGNRDRKTGSGTITSINSSGAVVGSGTSFTTQARVGNYIYADGKEFIIVAIADNTHCTVLSGIHGGTIPTESSVSYTLSEKPAFVAASECSDTSGDSGDSSKVYGVDTSEIAFGAASVTDVSIVQGGSNYKEVPSVVIAAGAYDTAEATATLTNGVVTKITVTDNGGINYPEVPDVFIDTPRRTILTANVNTSTETITYPNHGINNGDGLVYYKVGGGTAIGGLTNGTTYYAGEVTTNTFKLYATHQYGLTSVPIITVASANVNITTNALNVTGHGLVDGARLNYSNQGGSTITGLTSGNDYYVIVVDADHFKLEDTVGGGAKDISGTGNDNQTFQSTGRYNLTGAGNNLQYFDLVAPAGITATAVAVLGSGSDRPVNGDPSLNSFVTGEQHVTHTGWVRKTVGTGGRAGRVQYETLVAMGSMSGDQNDDIQFPETVPGS